MATLRLIKPHESPAPAVEPEPVPIRLESLPTPLRAVVRDQPDGSLRIEAELPWLAIGTGIHAGSSHGGEERTAQVQDFDVEITSGGSARLVILTAPSQGARAQAAISAPRSRTGRLWSVVRGGLIIATAAACGYALAQLSSAKMALDPPRLAPLVSAPVPAPPPPVAAAPAPRAAPPSELELPAPPPPLPISHKLPGQSARNR